MMQEKLNSNMDPKYTESWIPIKQILNGMIQLDSGEYVTGVKVAPKNIFIMDQTSQDMVISNLRNLYNSIDFEFWLLIADRPVDIDVYLSRLQIMYNETQNAAVRKLIMQDINKANLFMNVEYNVVDTEYYILFKEKRLEIVQKKLHNIISGLASSGLQSNQTSNSDLRMVLDNFLNGGEQSTFGTVMV
ncbi:MAG: hypothetical protein E7172_00635 [Firmicutes bacterium]|nr:hypothetical protein [Bacillota bacterium]